MTSIHSNNSHKTLDSNRQNDPKALEQQDSPKTFTEVEPLLTSEEALLPKADPQIEAPSMIVLPPPTPTAPKRQFTPKRVVIASGITAVIVGSAIAGNYVRTEQYNKIAQAGTLLSETCHTPTLSDAESLNTAETGWNNAIARLQGIPPFPGFGIKDAQALRSDYASCKTNIDATKLFQEAETISQEARSAVQRSPALSEEEWANHVEQLNSAIEHLGVVQTSFGNSADLTESLPIFSDVKTRLQEYKQILTVAQNRRDREHNAVLNFNTAKDLYQKFEATPAPTNATTQKSAEATLQGAIDRLKKIPPNGTTVSTAANEARQTYIKKLDTLRTEPARRQLRQLVTSFNELSSSLESGMSTQELASSIGNLANQLDQLQQASNTSQHSALRHFQTALDDYRFAQSLLNLSAKSDKCFTGIVGDNDLYLRNTSSFYRTLVDSYKVEPAFTWQGWAIRLESAKEKTAFDAIWARADRNVKTAEQLIEQ